MISWYYDQYPFITCKWVNRHLDSAKLKLVIFYCRATIFGGQVLWFISLSLRLRTLLNSSLPRSGTAMMFITLLCLLLCGYGFFVIEGYHHDFNFLVSEGYQHGVLVLNAIFVCCMHGSLLC